MMLCSIELNYQFCFITIEVNNEITNDFLPVELYVVCHQKIIP